MTATLTSHLYTDLVQEITPLQSFCCRNHYVGAKAAGSFSARVVVKMGRRHSWKRNCWLMGRLKVTPESYFHRGGTRLGGMGKNAPKNSTRFFINCHKSREK